MKTLSDKTFWATKVKEDDIELDTTLNCLFVGDVREFIKRLKEDVLDTFEQVDKLDKLAGDKLIKENKQKWKKRQ